MSALDALIEHWRLFDETTPPFFHRRDVPFAARGLQLVHNHVQPFPFVGDLRRADIWILMLNSKLGTNDERDESTEPYRSLFRKNLRQDYSDQEYPLLSVDPALKHTGTYQYYGHTRGLDSLISRLAEVARLRPDDARRVVSRRVAILELLPYRSSTFPSNLDQLPSVNLARAAAKEASINKLLVVPWGIGRWNLRPSVSVIHRPARTFSFAPGGASGYGEAIIKRLLRVYESVT